MAEPDALLNATSATCDLCGAPLPAFRVLIVDGQLLWACIDGCRENGESNGS